MLNYSTRYTVGVEVVQGYPLGRAKNESSEGAKDGLPYERDWVNDFLGFAQASLVGNPSNTPETANASDILNGILAQSAAIRAPSIFGGTESTTPGTWEVRDDAQVTSVNLASIAPVTSGGAVGEEVGDLKLEPSETASESLAVAGSPSKKLAQLGVAVGVDSFGTKQVASLVSNYGFRAVLERSGGSWGESSTVTGGQWHSSTADGVTTTVTELDSGATLNVAFSDANGIAPPANWVCTLMYSSSATEPRLGYTPILDRSVTSGTEARVRFLASCAAGARVTWSGGTPVIDTASAYGITSLSYDNSPGVLELTVNHEKRTGPISIQVEGGSRNHFLQATRVSDTQFKITENLSSGTVTSIGEISFSIQPGALDFVVPNNGTMISIANGVGTMRQDSALITGAIGFVGANK